VTERPGSISRVAGERATADATSAASAGADGVLAALREALGDDGVLVGAAARERRTADWSGAAAAEPLAVLLPRTPAQVAQALRACSAWRQPLSVQGGLTGLAGGANAQPGEIVLSLGRLDAIEDIDELGGTAVVQAGVTLERMQAAAAERGWFFPLDLGARGSCQLGGNAATNAGGNRVLRYGMMRDSVLGLEVALADGTLLSMLDRVVKNNAGLDLKHLFVGCEGTLGVITRLALKLVPQPVAGCTALCALPDFAAAAVLLREARRRLPELTAFELMWDDFLEASLGATGAARPFAQRHPLYALIETLGADEEAGTAAVERFLEGAIEAGTATDAILAQSGEQARRLWDLREGVSELLPQLHPCVPFDVSIALPRMEGFVAAMRAQLEARWPACRHLFFGHLGDGNLHLLSGPYADAAQLEAVEEVVYRAVEEAGGSISAEHGIGVLKKPFLHHSREPAQIDLMRRLKATLDPLGILNPGRMVPGVSDAPEARPSAGSAGP
jgi:FAD/FMN-containing dehydrogenase